MEREQPQKLTAGPVSEYPLLQHRGHFVAKHGIGPARSIGVRKQVCSCSRTGTDSRPTTAGGCEKHHEGECRARLPLPRRLCSG